jgi:hypothetical protein
MREREPGRWIRSEDQRFGFAKVDAAPLPGEGAQAVFGREGRDHLSEAAIPEDRVGVYLEEPGQRAGGC